MAAPSNFAGSQQRPRPRVRVQVSADGALTSWSPRHIRNSRFGVFCRRSSWIHSTAPGWHLTTPGNDSVRNLISLPKLNQRRYTAKYRAWPRRWKWRNGRYFSGNCLLHNASQRHLSLRVQVESNQKCEPSLRVSRNKGDGHEQRLFLGRCRGAVWRHSSAIPSFVRFKLGQRCRAKCGRRLRPSAVALHRSTGATWGDQDRCWRIHPSAADLRGHRGRERRSRCKHRLRREQTIPPGRPSADCSWRRFGHRGRAAAHHSHTLPAPQMSCCSRGRDVQTIRARLPHRWQS